MEIVRNKLVAEEQRIFIEDKVLSDITSEQLLVSETRFIYDKNIKKF